MDFAIIQPKLIFQTALKEGRRTVAFVTPVRCCHSLAAGPGRFWSFFYLPNIGLPDRSRRNQLRCRIRRAWGVGSWLLILMSAGITMRRRLFPGFIVRSKNFSRCLSSGLRANPGANRSLYLASLAITFGAFRPGKVGASGRRDSILENDGHVWLPHSPFGNLVVRLRAAGHLRSNAPAAARCQYRYALKATMSAVLPIGDQVRLRRKVSAEPA